MRKLNHKHICKLLDFHEDYKYFYCLLEYCNQGDLGKELSKYPQKML